jgi:myosin-3
MMCINDLKSNFSSSNASPNKKPLTSKDQQMQLADFAQNVHMMNQEVHKNLRQNKAGIQMKNIEKLPADYKKPPGFLLIPGLLGSIPGGDHHILNLIQANGKTGHAFEVAEDPTR